MQTVAEDKKYFIVLLFYPLCTGLGDTGSSHPRVMSMGVAILKFFSVF
jgi:hypothetical protein